MSQNNKLLEELGLPVLNEDEKVALRRDWQNKTWNDMITSLHNYGKYVMLRPTGFGKTYTCACSCNIGKDAVNSTLTLHEGSKDNIIAQITDNRLSKVYQKKVIFVYVSDILKQTFNTYAKPSTSGKPSLITSPDGRIIYETYASVALNWANMQYLEEVLDINNVGLIIFDEVQRMGAIKTSEALKVALPEITKRGIFYIGATATIDRLTGPDVVNEYFTSGTKENPIYCWGKHIYDINSAFEKGLLLPPKYVYIARNEDVKKAKNMKDSTIKSMLTELCTKYAKSFNYTPQQLKNNPSLKVQELERLRQANLMKSEDKVVYESMQDLQRCVIRNSAKLIHDSMLDLYQCRNSYLKSKYDLPDAEFNSKKLVSKTGGKSKLPRYMRFLVFAPGQDELKRSYKVVAPDGEEIIFDGLVKQTVNDFEKAFGRYGYKVRSTVVSSANALEKNNVGLIDNQGITPEEIEALEKAERLSKKYHLRNESEDSLNSSQAINEEDMTIDLIFSINMLNVGYHVNHITGLIFKRWTASNQIYLQQLGRCLSADSDNIPIVFDYVNALDSRGVAAPLYRYDKQLKKVTENIDGTSSTVDPDEIQSNVPNPNDAHGLITDANGNIVNPRELNFIDAKYIIIDKAEATLDDILERHQIYEKHTSAVKVFEPIYRQYIQNNGFTELNGNLTFTGNLAKSSSLYSFMHQYLTKQAEAEGKTVTKKSLSVNIEAFASWMKGNKKTVVTSSYFLADGLDPDRESFQGQSDLSILTPFLTTKESNGSIIQGINLKVLVPSSDKQSFLSNKRVMDFLSEHNVDMYRDIIYVNLN